MKSQSTLTALALTLVICASLALQAQSADSSGSDLDAYQATLRRWSERVAAINGDPYAAQQLRAELPQVVVVITPEGGRLEARTNWLNDALGQIVTAKPENRAAIAEQIKARLQTMQEQAEEFRQASSGAAERGRLQEILARREFRRVQGPSALELWRRRVASWINRALNRIFGRIPSDTQAGQILVWLAIAAATCVLAIWLKRRAGRAAVEHGREPVPFAPSARNWRQWLADARAAAQAGRWRDAVHLAYWAGISHLEEGGAWVPDRARTPREYLRLLPALSDRQPVLTALTRNFEVIWYGRREAGAEDFREAVARLEQLGCR